MRFDSDVWVKKWRVKPLAQWPYIWSQMHVFENTQFIEFIFSQQFVVNKLHQRNQLSSHISSTWNWKRLTWGKIFATIEWKMPRISFSRELQVPPDTTTLLPPQTEVLLEYSLKRGEIKSWHVKNKTKFPWALRTDQESNLTGESFVTGVTPIGLLLPSRSEQPSHF